MCSSSYQALNSSSIAGGGSVMVSSSPLCAIGDPSFLESIGTIGDAPCESAALFRQEHRHAGGLQLEDRARHLVDDYRGEALGWLVEEDRARVAGQAAGDA